MASQFFGLNIAYTGLLGANAGLNTTATIFPMQKQRDTADRKLIRLQRQL